MAPQSSPALSTGSLLPEKCDPNPSNTGAAGVDSRGTISKTERQRKDWEKIFADHISGEGFLSKMYWELLQLNSEKTNNSIKK